MNEIVALIGQFNMRIARLEKDVIELKVENSFLKKRFDKGGIGLPPLNPNFLNLQQINFDIPSQTPDFDALQNAEAASILRHLHPELFNLQQTNVATATETPDFDALQKSEAATITVLEYENESSLYARQAT